MLESPLSETEPSECSISIDSVALSYPARCESRIEQDAEINYDSEEERLVQPMQAVGENHYDGMDAMREQAAGKLCFLAPNTYI